MVAYLASVRGDSGSNPSEFRIFPLGSFEEKKKKKMTLVANKIVNKIVNIITERKNFFFAADSSMGAESTTLATPSHFLKFLNYHQRPRNVKNLILQIS